MGVLDGNFALGCGPGTDYPKIYIFQCMLEWTDAITNDVLEPTTFVLAYPTVHARLNINDSSVMQYRDKTVQFKIIKGHMWKKPILLHTLVKWYGIIILEILLYDIIKESVIFTQIIHLITINHSVPFLQHSSDTTILQPTLLLQFIYM